MNKLLFMTSKKILLLLSILFLWTCGGGGSKAPTEPVEPAPVSNFTATPTSGLQPLEVVFTSTATGTIASYAWNVDTDTDIEGTAATFTHTYTDAGTYDVTLTVTGPGGSNPKTVADMITVTSAAPTPTTATTQTTQEDGSTTISLTATDPNGQAVTFAITTDPTSGTATLSGTDITYTPNANFYGTDSVAYTASNGTYTSDPVTITITVTGEDDGNPTTNDVSATTDEDTAVTIDLDATEIDGDNYSFTIVTQPTNGTLGSVSGNQVEYTPNQDFNGTDTFTFEATDDRTSRRNVATATITVNAVNDAPVANDVTASMDENKEFNRFQPVTITLDATDVEGDALTYSVVGDVSSGTLGSISDNQIIYTPTQDFNGTDTFTYKANDGTDDSNTATVTITVAGVNDAPVTQNQTASMNEDTAVEDNATITLLSTDVDGDSVTYTIVSDVSNGTTSLSGSTVIYIPTANFNGTDTFTFKANDGTVDSNTSTVTITIAAVNDAPVANDVSASTDEDTAVNITLSGTDIEGDALTYSVVGTNNGTVTISGSTATYTPTQDFNGTDTFTFKANDGTDDSNTATATVTINAVNDAPIANDVTASTDENIAVNITLSGTDIDGDTLTFSIVSDATNGTTSVTDSVLTYTSNDEWGGTETITYKVNDGSLDSNSSTVTITVNGVNDNAPTVDNITNSTDEDTVLTIALSATDVDGDSQTFSLASNPINGTATISNDTLTYTPNQDFNGLDLFSYKSNDGAFDSNAGNITITINPVNDAPQISMTNNSYSVLNDREVSFEAILTDVDNDVSELSLSSTIDDKWTGDTRYYWMSHNQNFVADESQNWNVKIEYNSTSGNFDITYRPALNTITTGSEVAILALTASDGLLTSAEFDVEIQIRGLKITLPSGEGNPWSAVNNDYPNGCSFWKCDATAEYNWNFEVSDTGFASEGTVDWLFATGGPTAFENYDNGGQQITRGTWTSSSTGTMYMLMYGSNWKRNPDNPDNSGGPNIAPNVASPPHNSSEGDGMYRDSWRFITGVPANDGYIAYSPLFEWKDGIITNPIDYERWGVARSNRDVLHRGQPFTMSVGGDNMNARLYRNDQLVSALDRTTVSRELQTLPVYDQNGDIVRYREVMMNFDTSYMPSAAAKGDGYQIKLTNNDGSVIYDESPEFSLTDPGISNPPAAGSVVTYGDTLIFDYDGSQYFRNNVGFTVRVELRKGLKPDDSNFSFGSEQVANYNVKIENKIDGASYHNLKDGIYGTWYRNQYDKPDGTGNTSTDSQEGLDKDYVGLGQLPFIFESEYGLEDGDDYYLLIGNPYRWNSGQIYIDNSWQDGYPQTIWWSDHFAIDDGVNDPPTGENATSTTNEDTPIDITLVGTDGDTDDSTLTYSLISTPTNGTATIADSVVTYTPSLNWSGTDSIAYQVSDGNSSSGTYVVSITVNPVNDAPVASSESVTVSGGGASQIVLTASDVDGDTLTYSIVTDTIVGATTSLTGSTLLYLPPSGFTGVDQITFKANDGTVDSNTATVTITVQ